MVDNQSVFRNVEFDSWAFRTRLINAQRFLIGSYLQKSGKTLEAGTGGGKILFEMRALGFERLFGFDFVPEFIGQAKKKEAGHSICFEVGDAICLRYDDSSFDQIIYLQQILSFIDDPPLRFQALTEAHRVLRPGGTALFSFLSFESRLNTWEYWPYLAYLGALRTVRKSRLSIQSMPWLKHDGKFNRGALLDKGPYVYWFKTREVCELLLKASFRINGIGSSRQIEDGKMGDS